MSKLKLLAGTAAALGAAGAGLSALVFEGALNIRFSQWISGHFNLRDPEQDALGENEYSMMAHAWWDSYEDKHEEALEDKNGDIINCTVVNAEEPTHKWAVIVHGYTSSPEGMCRYAMEYNKRGYNCVMPLLRGHGKDSHRYCSMGWYDKDMVVNWIEWIVLQDPDAQIVIHGESMGAATTMLTTGEKLPTNVRCAVSDCGYTSVYAQYTSVLESKGIPAVPLIPMVNAYSKAIGHFDFKKCSPLEAVKRSVTPTLFVHGERDDFVPFSMLEEVYNACGAPKDKFSVPGAVHASSSNLAPEFYWEQVDKWLAQYIK